MLELQRPGNRLDRHRPRPVDRDPRPPAVLRPEPRRERPVALDPRADHGPGADDRLSRAEPCPPTRTDHWNEQFTSITRNRRAPTSNVARLPPRPPLVDLPRVAYNSQPVPAPWVPASTT